MNELKDYLSFEFTTTDDQLSKSLVKNYDILFFHQDYFKIRLNLELLENINKIKILASDSDLNENLKNIFMHVILLPFNIGSLNNFIENSIIKKVFSNNSAIKIKKYILNKNEKKLTKNIDFISLTEKEIQFLELLLYSKQSISKKKILEDVWNYSSNADTHTVETHIYRLRKKINEKFNDYNFILNNKDGYYL